MGRRQHGEGSLYQRGKKGGRAGQWVAVADLGYRNGRRDRREFTGSTSAEAMGKRQKFLDRKRDGFTMPRGRAPYVSEWMLHWLHHIAKARVEPTTWHRSYRQKTEDYIVPFFERVKLADLAEEDIEAWHSHMLATKARRGGGTLSPATITTAHRIFSSGIKAAVVRKKLPRNPLSNVPPPRAEHAELAIPTTAETKRILAACKERPGGARWVLAITTGLRQGEVLALEWRDVQLASPASVSVSRSAARVEGERIVKAPKSAKSRRTVPLPAITVAALKAHRAGQVASLTGLVFIDAKGRPLAQRDDWQEWRDLLGSLGLPYYRVHDMRHGYATVLLEEGVDPRVVQDLLGHASGVLLERYQHVREGMHRAAADAIDRALGQP
jgi:integrase